MGGELGGVAPVMFCMEPGGEELGVTCVMVMGPGEVLRANGDTGVCFRWRSDDLMIFRRSLSLKESDLCGEEGSLGDGVPLEECPGLSRGWPLSLFRNRLKIEGRFFIFPLPLERWRKSFPTR